MADDFHSFFEQVTGHAPYPYQVALGLDEWPDVIEVPTGLGKTSAVVVAWLWKRLRKDPDPPRRLVYCLPMRVLVEQTVSNARHWIRRAAPAFQKAGIGSPSSHVLMGGEVDIKWIDEPSSSAVIVGTQDMLLSRALMRGYSMSRYQWPIHFALLHNDAMWVFDEVQLMGPGLETSAQLEAFRRSRRPARTCRTTWMSATLDRDWLGTVDFRPHLEALGILTIGDDDRARAGERIQAVKRLIRADVILDREKYKSGARSYTDQLARAVLEAHRPGTQTLVILNVVARAQGLYRKLVAEVGGSISILLLHARFRPAEREAIHADLAEAPSGGRIVVATQAVEAGLDISSAVLFTELAPWSSLVQRFGRCNRYGEVHEGADIYWVDIGSDGDQAPPYEEVSLSEARAILYRLEGAGISDLPPVTASRSVQPVLRWKDFVELYDTEPDLSGFDIDVSPYIRDPGPPQVQVFWRGFDDQVGEQRPPHRSELCAASMGQIRQYLGVKIRGEQRRYWMWDGLDERWIRAERNIEPRPGAVLLLKASAGGYAADVGFDAALRDPVPLIEDRGADVAPDSLSADPETSIGRFVSLAEHTGNVRRHVADLSRSAGLGAEDQMLLDTAALWHDVGKAHPAFQTALLDYRDKDEDSGTEPTTSSLWAKSGGRGRLRYRIEQNGTSEARDYFRHELASMLAWLEHGEDDDLIGYLVAAHHGKLRMALRALPGERAPVDVERFARGVWEGDVLPPVALEGLTLPNTELRLALMEIGLGDQGPSWTERTRRLLEREGPFRLAWLEALLRIVDQRASAEESNGTDRRS